MIEKPATNQRRTEIEPRRTAELARPVARRGSPVAVYDTVTEELTGWQFLRTWRWFGFIASAILFAIVCVFLANWQYDRGQQASTDNSIVSANFSATPVPIEKALPALDSYDVTQNWQRVSVTGVYRADDELYVRNRSIGGDNGFEVITPLQLSDGSTFLVDRGWVEPSPTDALAPGSVPRPAAGTVNAVVRLRPSEAPRGTGTSTGNLIESITLPRVQQQIGGDVYTGAYGVLDRQSPSAKTGLAPIQTTMPVEDVGFHYSYVLQWLFFALLGFGAIGYGAVKEYRRLNADDPEERVRANERMRKRASKAFTDEELEDEAIDGYLPLSRWGFSAGAVSPAGSPPRAVLRGTPVALDAEAPVDEAKASSAAPNNAAPNIAAPNIYVIEPGREPGDREQGDEEP